MHRHAARRLVAVFAAATMAAAAVTLTACNTVKGAGEDIKAVGQAGEDVLTGSKRNTKD